MDSGTLCEPIALPAATSVRVEAVRRPAGSAAPSPFPHFHEPAELIWFERAQGEVITEAGALPIAAGTLLYLPPMAAHDFRLEAGATDWVIVHCDPAAIADPARDGGDLAQLRVHSPGEPQRARLATGFAWLAALAAEGGRAGDVLALTQLLLGEFPRGAAAAGPAVGAALHRLRPALDLVAEAEGRLVTLEEAAARCLLSPTYFSRAFAARVGMGFAEYARQYRLRAAARSLTTGAARVSEIAYASGFLNPSHFSAAFHKRYGVSPSQFRRLHRARGS
ncbi:AraC family transcriptional regulator [Erythrobacter sp. NE805]|uniref:helix-turn-helix transcriptional regulator n=1 Tax=Erythrobacter sp. NE805 TaxID=3389875 RepID=UPI00396B3C8E